MPPDSTSFINTLFDPSQWTMINIVQVIVALITIGLAIYPSWKRWRIQRILQKELPKEFFSKEAIELATRYYIPPYCSDTDPTQRDDAVTQSKLNSESQSKLFPTIDNFIKKIPKEPFLWLLSDSGTGKSSFVLNYYARNRRGFWWRRQRLAVVRLGIPDVEKYITPIQKKAKTVLFLDGLDEDTKAVENYEKRVHELMGWCGEFKRVLITCRTQFFPNDAAIPRRTDILRPAIRPAGTPATYEFSKLYIAPFTDEQVKTYLKKCYPFKQRKKREEAFAMVKKHSELLERPMLLAYVPDLLKSGKTVQYTFQLYEEMVDAWLEREYPYVKDTDKASLRDFSERLAIDLYTKRNERGAERVERKQLAKLAQEWNNINLNEWQLSSRSLLNRDAAGYYKFAHRSIMEYLFVKRAIEDHKHLKISRTDQMNAFLFEIMKAKLPEAKHYLLQPFENVKEGFPVFGLRAQASGSLGDEVVLKMLQEWGFFDSGRNKEGKGFFYHYEQSEQKGVKIVINLATGLAWQQSGSKEALNYADAEKYILELNNQKFGGYNDWRLPTLEEGMSLMEPRRVNLYIDPMFDKTQNWIWTADKIFKERAWVINFSGGHCLSSSVNSNRNEYVRAVRSGQSTI